MSVLNDDETIAKLRAVFLDHYKDFNLQDDQAHEMAINILDDVVDFGADIEMEELGRAAQSNIRQIANALSHLSRLRGAVAKVKCENNGQDHTAVKSDLDALEYKLKALREYWLQQEHCALRQQNPFTNIKGLEVTPSKAGRPRNTLANILAYSLGRQFEVITGKRPAITKATYADMDPRSGRYISLVMAVFDIFEFTEANARSAAEGAVQKIKKVTRRKT